MRPKRQGMIIWFKHRNNIKHIKRYGHLVYTSRKLKYVVLYVNKNEIDHIKQQLSKYHFIRNIEHSYRPFIRTQFDSIKPDEEKKYDYRFGI